jgi:hypothetical protein
MAASTRLPFVDNLRSMTIMLVVSMHAAVTYSNFGRWYFMEPPPTDKLSLLFFGMYQSFLQAWFMGFLFLPAGYFVPGSLLRKGKRKFMVDRMFRLGVPALIYMIAIEPFIDWFMLPMFRHGRAPDFGGHWLRYVTSTDVLEGTGPMWFAVALLIFSVVYASLASPRESEAVPPPPGNLQVMLLIVSIAVCTFLMRTVQPLGTAVYNMQLGYFSQYIILFAVGVAAWRGNWLVRIPYGFGMRWWAAAIAGGVPMWLAIMVGGGALSGTSLSVFQGGWHWQSAGIAFWESYFCVGTCLGLAVFFREKLNDAGPIARFLSDNAFAVYVFHPPLLIATTFALHPFEAPAAVKFAIASALAIGVSFATSALLLRRIPLLKQIL